ncbi:sigma-70 family RNA polymerase sigma factor [Corallococcus sp. H22C18031201]|uniref:RNA polymerase sigma factor n=1 Tax=Citreicoccus inhibens TaxID=2849499 RepID=UPI000E70A189|nr:RNA polymerase sigma factor [Citreicoccus inhibens]MBU8897639.1 RNA polymerase sigma factor [Citreicoccus inhibens]RJS19314.1 sigma-70 family RNA polymerase sigma factor [Corallococcus sp. H22C18031201]
MTGTSQPILRVIEGGASQDRRAFLRELYSKYGGSVQERCRYLLKDAIKAEDAMQDVFARALSHSESFRAEASPLTWLMKIATHQCLNQLRSEGAAWRRWFERDAAARPEGHGGPEAMETRVLVRRLLARVDAETQAAAIHYHVDGMTLEEVAALLGRSVPTVRKRLEHFATLGGEELRVR